MPYLRSKWPKSIPYLWPKRLKTHTLWGRTHLYSPYQEVPLEGSCEGGYLGLIQYELQHEWSSSLLPHFLLIMFLETDILAILRKFHCIFPQTPCMANPCLQHGTSFCQPIYNRDDYQCVCKAGFTGKYCGMGQFISFLHGINYIFNLKGALSRYLATLQKARRCLRISWIPKLMT